MGDGSTFFTCLDDSCIVYSVYFYDAVTKQHTVSRSTCTRVARCWWSVYLLMDWLVSSSLHHVHTFSLFTFGPLDTTCKINRMLKNLFRNNTKSIIFTKHGLQLCCYCFSKLNHNLFNPLTTTEILVSILLGYYTSDMTDGFPYINQPVI